MKREETLMAGGEVAAYLGRLLGPGQNWEGVLNDFRQDRRDFGCAPLLPVARARPEGCRAKVPMYRAQDVRTFVAAVRAHYGTTLPFPAPVCHRYVVDYASADLSACWRIQRATPIATATT